MTSQNDPTPYTEVNQVLQPLLAGIQAILKENFTGMYLYGSLTYGGFGRSSDVDYIVVTEEELSEEEFRELQEMHRQIAKMENWCATQLEGSYIPRQALLGFVPERALFFHIDRGEGEVLKRMQLDREALQQAWRGAG
jgi:predicted nucleotidyltransferase